MKYLEALVDYLAQRSPNATVHVLESLLETFELLAQSPMIGTLRDDLRPNLRVFPGRGSSRNYLVFYFPMADGIQVSAIIHGARDLAALFAVRPET